MHISPLLPGSTGDEQRTLAPVTVREGSQDGAPSASSHNARPPQIHTQGILRCRPYRPIHNSSKDLCPAYIFVLEDFRPNPIINKKIWAGAAVSCYVGGGG